MTDTWESAGIVVERWESATTPGQVLNVIVRDGEIVASVSDEQLAAAIVAYFAGSVPVREGDGAGGALSGTYPDPGLNTDALASWLNGLIQAGVGIETVFDPGPGEDPPSLTISATGDGGASLDVVAYFAEGGVTVADLGGSFDEGTLTIPGFAGLPAGRRILVANEGDANDGIWTHQGDGECTQTIALDELLSFTYGGLEIAYGVDLQFGRSGSVRVSTADGGVTWTLTGGWSWLDLAGKPAAIGSLEAFKRPTLINARLHFGGEAAWEGGDPLPNLFDPDTGEFLGPIYDAAFIADNGPLYSYNLDGSPSAPFPASDRPIIDHQPHAGGSVLATEQDDWRSNGVWVLSFDEGDDKWYGTKPTTLDWATPEMIVEGTPFWIGSGRYHRFKVGAWGFSAVQPTDPGHTWNFHRNSAADTYFDPGDTGLLAGNAQAAIEEVHDYAQLVQASKFTVLPAPTVAGGIVTMADAGGEQLEDSGVTIADLYGDIETAVATALSAADLTRVIGGQDAGPRLSDTTTETRVLDGTITLPALGPGELLMFRGAYQWLNNSGAVRAFTLRIKVGSTTVIAIAQGGLGSNATARSGHIDGIIRANGTNDADVEVNLLLTNATDSTNTLGGEITVHGTMTEAIQTAGLAFDMTVQHSAAVSTLWFELQSFSIWKVAA